LFALFSLQIAVILFNVSGTFEIEINQRYVLVALPLFAIVMAVGLHDALKNNSKMACGAAAILAVCLSIYHVESFNKDILYNKNHLLAEENFLNTELKKLPKNSIFIYGRPWQMLASGFNGFSERQFLSWSPGELEEWRKFSEDNIYIVRGQDGYGDVDRNSRVVGFKTTGAIGMILEQYRTDRIFSQNKPFGYPLEAYKIGRERGESTYAASIAWNSEDKNLEWILPDTLVNYEIFVNGNSLDLEKSSRSAHIESSGMHYATLIAYPENDTAAKHSQFFIRNEKNRLLQDSKPDSWSQVWGEPQMRKSVEHNAIKIDNRFFEFGIGSHAASKLVWNLNGAYNKFHAFIGLDDESACGNGAIWVVKGDGKELYRSRVLASKELDSIRVDIGNVNALELETLDNGDKDCDHANWAGAWLE
jgi:hypothetical protein